MRGLLLTGFPWLLMGYAHAADSPLAGYAPLLGVYGVSLLATVSAGLLAVLRQAGLNKQGKIAFAVFVLLWLAGAALHRVEWTSPAGEPLKVSLLQGNIGQGVKFAESSLVGTVETYRRLAQG